MIKEENRETGQTTLVFDKKEINGHCSGDNKEQKQQIHESQSEKPPIKQKYRAAQGCAQ